MGRDLTFLAIGVAVGFLAANLVRRVGEEKKADLPEKIQDRISDRLESLERQYSTA